MFWLCDSAMYTHMSKLTSSFEIDRGIALHKMIRFLTMSLAGEGYLNFMGNEFGHPEWIDFPREGNGWSSYYCRRQWHLADDKLLKYEWLLEFDKAMVAFAKEKRIFTKAPISLYIDEEAQVLVYERNGVLFAFNFSPTNSYENYFIPTRGKGAYAPLLSTDEEQFGGFDRISQHVTYTASKGADGRMGFGMYLPTRTAVCLGKKK